MSLKLLEASSLWFCCENEANTKISLILYICKYIQHTKYPVCESGYAWDICGEIGA